MNKACCEQLKQRQQNWPLQISLKDQILPRLVTREHTLGTVAQVLAISPRTLQRKLRDEGTSFESLVDETRKELAENTGAADSSAHGRHRPSAGLFKP